MFNLSGTHIQLTSGDTGLLTILLGGDELPTGSLALFTVRHRSGRTMAEMIIEPKDNRMQIPFTHDLTDGWKEDEYRWDVRFVTDPVKKNGRIVDGREVITPMRPAKLTVMKAEGRI